MNIREQFYKKKIERTTLLYGESKIDIAHDFFEDGIYAFMHAFLDLKFMNDFFFVNVVFFVPLHKYVKSFEFNIYNCICNHS